MELWGMAIAPLALGQNGPVTPNFVLPQTPWYLVYTGYAGRELQCPPLQLNVSSNFLSNFPAHFNLTSPQLPPWTSPLPKADRRCRPQATLLMVAIARVSLSTVWTICWRWMLPPTIPHPPVMTPPGMILIRQGLTGLAF